MLSWVEMLVAIFTATLASGGFWSFIQKKRDGKDARTKMMLGLGHDRIIWLGLQYIEQGHISREEYANLIKYLYEPYRELGGNGTAERIIEEVKKLPIKTGKGED
jgi:hypothetical protein